MFSRIRLDKLRNNIDCSSVLEDGKIPEAVHGRFEHHHCSKLCACCGVICNDAQWKVTQREASFAFYSRAPDTADRSSNNKMVFMQSIFSGIWI